VIALLMVRNDCVAMPHRLGPPGMGSEIYAELADDWGIVSGVDLVDFWADFALEGVPPREPPVTELRGQAQTTTEVPRS